MTTSGSTSFTQTRDQIITTAFELLSIYGIGRTIEAEDHQLAVKLFQMMIKAWQTDGLHLWPKEQGVLYITPYTEKYQLGNESGDAYATLLSDQVMTRLNGALLTSATSITVDSTAGMTTGDFIGVVLADKTIHWTTLTVNSSTTLTLSIGVVSAANDDAYIYTFTSRISKPLRILQTRLVTGIDNRTTTSNQVEMNMGELSYQEYMQFPNKMTYGTPNQYMYLPKRVKGEFYLWPRPNDGSKRVHFTFERMLEDVNNIDDECDFPTEWLEAVAFQLAVRLGIAYGKEQKLAAGLAPMASAMMEKLLSWDTEISGITILPSTGYGD